MRCIAFLVTAIFSIAVFAETITGKVVAVADGDTLTVLDETRQQIKVRLNAIDAPEKNQAFGNASKKSLSKLCFGKPASINTHGLDKYGRTIGDVTCEGQSANEYQISNGMAWVFRKYSQDEHLLALEATAKNNRDGLWDDPNAIAPWDFRHGVTAPVQLLSDEPAKPKAVRDNAGFSCGGKRYCKEMGSCEEAMHYLNKCGVYRLDRDRDGIPCESIC